MKLRNLILLAICAAFCVGGTFTCKSESGAVRLGDPPTTQH